MSDNELRIFYMRDNHTFKPLSLDVDQALLELLDEWNEGWNHGMLASKHDRAPKELHADGDWESFKLKVRWWYKDFHRRVGPNFGIVSPHMLQMSLESYEFASKILHEATHKELPAQFLENCRANFAEARRLLEAQIAENVRHERELCIGDISAAMESGSDDNPCRDAIERIEARQL